MKERESWKWIGSKVHFTCESNDRMLREEGKGEEKKERRRERKERRKKRKKERKKKRKKEGSECIE